MIPEANVPKSLNFHVRMVFSLKKTQKSLVLPPFPHPKYLLALPNWDFESIIVLTADLWI
jgi:hypothetical protein